MFSLKDKVALVTGASQGIGRATSLALAEAGAKVAIAARSTEKLASLAAEVTAAGGEALSIPMDVADPAQVKTGFQQLLVKFGKLDILVNNAAITYFEPVIGFEEKHFRLMFEVQVRAPFELAQLVLPGMRDRKSGWIVNISSGAGRHPQGPPFAGRRGGGGTVYGMCKAALERFTTGLASEVYEDGIAVNVVSPSGLVLTPGVLHHRLDQFTPPERHEPVEVMAEAAYVLATGDPAMLTGKITYAKVLLDEVGKKADSA